MTDHLVTGYHLAGCLVTDGLPNGNRPPVVTCCLVTDDLVAGDLVTTYLVTGCLVTGYLVTGCLVTG